MSEWIAAAAGVAGALAGAGGAVLGARLTAKAAIAQVASQRADNLDHWIRGQRRDAYTHLLEVADRSIALEQDVNLSVVVNGLTDAVMDQVAAAVNDLRAAAARVDICGPAEARLAADKLRDTATRALALMTDVMGDEGTTMEAINNAANSRDEAHEAFRKAAAKALGFE
ncbi:hypothetical protein ACGFMM_01260 [Streptomyces sp. NPDC048604]|uniref:hypothetical protein n=1 Tax=Streptomyces sp. NPDC048604 TaxID=3365578 RepID=UPI0037219427